MPKISNKMYNKYEEQFIIIQDSIKANNPDIKSNKQDSDEKMTKLTEDFKSILAAITD